MIPDIESAAKVSKDLFLDEKIPSEGCGTLGTLGKKRRPPKLSHTKG